MVLLDDVGPEQLRAYGESPIVADTPVIDCLADQGVRFTRMWGAPVCSPGRAQTLTGRLASRTGIATNVRAREELDDAEVTLAEVLRDAGYTTGFAGKWHLGGWRSPDGKADPESQGFDVFAGTPTNLVSAANPPAPDDGEEPGYYGFWHVAEGERTWERSYATSVDMDDAIDFVRGAEPPWFLLLALHAAHPPLAAPPRGLLHTPLPDAPTANQLYRAALEASDTELGRLLRSLGPGLGATTVVLLADNGTGPDGVLPPADPARAKGTLYELGIRVPLIVVGPGVAGGGRVSDALVSQVDLLPTLATWVGAEPPADLDGRDVSDLWTDPIDPAATHLDPLALGWSPLGHGWETAARDDVYKLVVHDPGDADAAIALYDLGADPRETDDLTGRPLDDAAWAALQRLAALQATLPPPPTATTPTGGE